MRSNTHGCELIIEKKNVEKDLTQSVNKTKCEHSEEVFQSSIFLTKCKISMRNLNSVTAWVLGFVNILKETFDSKIATKIVGFLSRKEIFNAKKIWIKNNQEVLRAD